MNVVEIVFSPTGGTEKVADIIGSRLKAKIDLSDASADFGKCEITGQDLAVIAMPSFGGRAPAVAIERLRKIRGNGAGCVLVCVYGNRAYEDTLAEMEDAARECGFQVTAAISAVAGHSMMPQYAAGRPDEADRKQLTDFADRIAGKTGPVSTVPGSRPYKKAGGAGLVPKPDKSCVILISNQNKTFATVFFAPYFVSLLGNTTVFRCIFLVWHKKSSPLGVFFQLDISIKCGLCAKTCPVRAIDTAQFMADSKKCISCMRCVKLCPQNARKVNGLMVSAAALAIKKACSVRKENELFL